MGSKTNYVGNRSGMFDEIIDRAAFVSPTFVDDPFTHRFSTIQAAIDWVYITYSPITSTDAVVIKVAPGTYTEQIHSYTGIWIVGQVSGMDATTGRSSVTIYNTGLDAAHYPFRSDEDEEYVMSGINIITDALGVYGKIPNANFQSCYFRYGYFIERNSDCYTGFSNCRFAGCLYAGFRLEGADLVGNRNITLRNSCELSNTPVLTSTHTGWGNFQIQDSKIQGNVNIRGDWGFRPSNTNMYGYAHRNVFDTTGEVSIASCVIQNGMYFISNPSGFDMIGSSFKLGSISLIPVGEADIIADVDITAQTYIGNTQQYGISGKIHTPGIKKHITPRAPDSYFSLQDAIDSIDVKGIIELNEDLIDLTALSLSGEKNITIDGKKLYSLTFTGDIVELGLNEQIIFYGISSLNGGNIKVNGNGAYVGFEETLTANAYVTLTAGTNSYCLVYTSTLKGVTGYPTISLDNADTLIISAYSRIEGQAGQPAIQYSVVADEKLKVKFSTLIHGDGGANSPIQTTALPSTISVYNTGLNAAWPPADFTNTIGSAGNITDVNIDF